MSRNSREKEPSAEIPHLITIVHADDEKRYFRLVEEALRDGFEEQDNPISVDYSRATSVEALFQSALKGKDGKQADIVLLDDNYQRSQDFFANLQQMLEITEKLDVPQPDILPEEPPGDWHSLDNMYFNLYSHPSSTHFAILLRALGLKGNIYVVSSGPPAPKNIQSELEHIKSNVPNLALEEPIINGMCRKEPYYRKTTIQYSSRPREDGFWETREAENLETALRSLIKLPWKTLKGDKVIANSRIAVTNFGQ